MPADRTAARRTGGRLDSAPMETLGEGPGHDGRASPPQLGGGQRLLWLLVLALAALGGAGLATAADRQPTDEARPELTWRAEQSARPWLEAMTAWLERLDDQAGALSAAGRGVLIGLAGQDEGRLSAAIADGEVVAGRVADLTAGLRTQRERQRAVVDDLRLGTETRSRLIAIDNALDASDAMPEVWAQLVANAQAGDAAAVTDRLVAIESVRGAINRALGLDP
jgi:hypothetical protein